MIATVRERDLYISETEPLVAGSVDEYTLQFVFPEAWDGYTNVAVFKTSDGTLKEVVIVNDEADIPWEVLQTSQYIQIGVYGTSGTKFRPTLWSQVLFVHPGAEQGDPVVDPETSPWTEAVQQMGEDLTASAAYVSQSATNVTHYPKIVENTWYVWDATQNDWVSTGVSATEPGPAGADGVDGVDGADGADGADGFSPTVSVSKEGKRTTVVFTDKDGDHTATILDGEDGSGSGGNGDMTKAIYDTNEDGIVNDADNAAKLNNQLPSYYAKASDVPTKVSDLTNDTGFITSSSLPTKVSDLTNDTGFITSSSLPTKVSDLTNDSGFITSSSVPTATSDLTNDSGYITSSDIPTDVSYFTNDADYITMSDVPTNLSQFTDDVGYLTSPVAIADGGTGETTLADAKASLGIAALETALGQIKFSSVTISSGSYKTYTFSDTCHYIIICVGQVTAGQGIVFGFINSTGSAHNVSKTAASSVTAEVQTDKTKLKVSNGSNSGMLACFVLLNGTMPTVS